MIEKRLLIAALLVLLPTYAPAGRAATIPYVACPSDGQSGPLENDGNDSDEPNLSLSAAETKKLAFYGMPNGGGVLAPRGWHCFYRYGSSGWYFSISEAGNTTLVDKPDEMKSAVIFSLMNGETSGRFDVAYYLSRLFPSLKPDYVKIISDEGLQPKEKFAMGSYPDDTITYRSDRLADYVTPAHKTGIGTLGLMPTDLPIKGFASEHDEDGLGFVIAAIRLPKKLAFLEQAILSSAKNCNEHLYGGGCPY